MPATTFWSCCCVDGLLHIVFFYISKPVQRIHYYQRIPDRHGRFHRYVLSSNSYVADEEYLAHFVNVTTASLILKFIGLNPFEPKPKYVPKPRSMHILFVVRFRW